MSGVVVTRERALLKLREDLTDILHVEDGVGEFDPLLEALNEAYNMGLATAEQNARPKWIAISEALPDSDIWVLVANDQPDYALVQLEFTDDSEGHGEPYWAAEGGDLALCNYPFWTPILNPPGWDPPPEGASDV